MGIPKPNIFINGKRHHAMVPFWNREGLNDEQRFFVPVVCNHKVIAPERGNLGFAFFNEGFVPICSSSLTDWQNYTEFTSRCERIVPIGETPIYSTNSMFPLSPMVNYEIYTGIKTKLFIENENHFNVVSQPVPIKVIQERNDNGTKKVQTYNEYLTNLKITSGDLSALRQDVGIADANIFIAAVTAYFFISDDVTIDTLDWQVNAYNNPIQPFDWTGDIRDAEYTTDLGEMYHRGALDDGHMYALTTSIGIKLDGMNTLDVDCLMYYVLKNAPKNFPMYLQSVITTFNLEHRNLPS